MKVLALALAAALLAACSGASDDASGGNAETPAGDGSTTTPPATPAPGADASAPAPPPAPVVVDWTVNGYPLDAREQAVVTILAKDVVPRVEGARADRVLLVARGAWWALKEGTWGQPLEDVYAYSNCNTSSGDKTIGPLEICGTGRAWQVGMAAVQVPGHTPAELEALAAKLFPGTPVADVLADVAAKAGFAKGSATSSAIVASTGSLRASWLLRVPAIGTATIVPGEVVPECIDGAKSWCFGSGWTETKKFAPTKAAAQKSISDLQRILDQLAPT